VEAPVRDDALPLAEEIGQHPVELHGQLVLEIRDNEAHFEAARRALHAALLDHSAETEALAGRHLPRGDLRGVVEEHHVLPACGERERAGDADAGENAEHENQTTFARGSHVASFIATRRRASARARRKARRAHTTLSNTAPSTSAYDGHT